MRPNGLSLAFCFFLTAFCADASSSQIKPIVTTSELTVGNNRFGFGLLSGNNFVNGANVRLRTYAVDGSQGRFVSEVAAVYRPIRTRESKRTVHRHSDGTQHVHTDDQNIRGMYTANLEFSRAGAWGIEMIVSRPPSPPQQIRLSVLVADSSSMPIVGSSAPASRNLTVEDVTQLRQIDTSPEPDPRLHRMRIADAIAQEKPQLIVFATPQFCTSRMCGPLVEIVRTLLPVFGEQVAFTHQEIGQDFAEKKVFPTVEEWRLKSEPWIYIVDRRGIVSARFEGLVTESEIESALREILN